MSSQSSSAEDGKINALKIIADPGLFLLAHEKELIKHLFYSSSSSSESSFDTDPRNIVKRSKCYRKQVKRFCPMKQFDSDGYFDAPHIFKQKRLVKKRKGSKSNPIQVTDSESD